MRAGSRTLDPRPGGVRRSGIALLGVLAAGPTALGAQQRDSVRTIAPVVVTAERMRTPLAATTTAVARVSGAELRERPVRTLAEALEAVPGLSFLDVDGLGLDPQLTVRGFYGGGEAEYVVVLLDGRPVNALESGLFDWDLVPLAAVESIEVVRGGTSSLYGDAALGGVINLVTARDQQRQGSASLAGGSRGVLRGSLQLASDVGGRTVSLFGAFQHADGFRAHAGRTSGSAGASLALARSDRGELSLSTLQHWRAYDEPGPLTAAELIASRTAVAPFYRFDAADERVHQLSLQARRSLARGVEASGYITGEVRAQEAVRTLPLSPAFADTKERVLHTARLQGSAQLRWSRDARALPGALLVGADWSAGRLRNAHYAWLAGDASAYEGATGKRGALDARGEGSRLTLGSFARYELQPLAALRLTAGARLDWLRDSFEPDEPAGSDEQRNRHVALSPQAGLNLRYLRSHGQEGHVFANAGRSFKAPTPDQLFDQRSIPVPFEPFRLTLSNPDLDPARGTSYEAGLYHRAELPGTGVAAAVSLAAYQLDMRDELDIDLQTYRYVNIGRSRHRGLEAGLEVEGAGVGAHASYTLQAVTFRYGEHYGNALKAVPRHSLSAGLHAASSAGLAGGVTVRSSWGIWLDDANTISLPGFTRVDARAAYTLARVRLELEVFNVLDRAYSTTGYADPAGTGTVYYYPAAGRVLQAGLAVAW